MKITNPVFKAANCLIKHALSKEVNKLRSIYGPRSEFHSSATISSMACVKELNTIKVCGTRRCGHTSAIIPLIDKFFKNKVIIIFYKQSMEKRFQDNFLKEYPNKDNIITATVNYLDKLRGTDDVDAIFVDTSSLLSHSTIDKITLDIAGPNFYVNRNMLLIFLE